MFTEDEVRDKAGKILGLDQSKTNEIIQGVGQLTTFKQLGERVGVVFNDQKKKPDGWYLPKDTNKPAIVLETKSTLECLDNEDHIKEIKRNTEIVGGVYDTVISILYNFDDIKVWINGKEDLSISKTLQPVEYYLKRLTNKPIDKQKIYNLTRRINDTLHSEFNMKVLCDRMVFTACTLVAIQFGAKLSKGMDYETLHAAIRSRIKCITKNNSNLTDKVNILNDMLNKIKVNSYVNQLAINNFIETVGEISESITYDTWNGEDIMGIFFNEFNRYKAKSEKGQVFTPDHITSFMYKLLDVNENDKVLDAACGSGAFLTKAMCNMIDSVGRNTTRAQDIKENQIFGIEFDDEVFALACANMLIHKDGKSNLVKMDSRYEEAGQWIKSKGITKVLMNPPYEDIYGCLKIVKNVMDNVPMHTKCAFLLPDKKLEKAQGHAGKKLLKSHRLEKIIKLPEQTFSEGVNVSIFIFTAGVPQNNEEIFSCYIEDDGLETVKNQGRQDINNKWSNIEEYWIKVIKRQSGNKTIHWIDPSKQLSYPSEYEYVLQNDMFASVFLEYNLFKEGFDRTEEGFKELNSILLDHFLIRYLEDINFGE